MKLELKNIFNEMLALRNKNVNPEVAPNVDEINKIFAKIPLEGNMLNQTITQLAKTGITYPLFLLYTEDKRYYANLFHFKNDKYLEKNNQTIMNMLFTYGKVGFKRVGNQILLVNPTKYKFDWNNDLIKAEGNYLDIRSSGYNYKNKTLKLDMNDYVLKADEEAYGCWFKFWYYWLQIANLLKIRYSNTKFLKKKLNYIIKNNISDVRKQEMASVLDDDTDFLITINNEEKLKSGRTKLPNRWEELKYQNNLQEINQTINEIVAWVDKRNGRRYNVDGLRKARNNTDEVGLSNANFEVLEYDVYQNLILFLEWWNKMGNNAELEYTYTKIDDAPMINGGQNEV